MCSVLARPTMGTSEKRGGGVVLHHRPPIEEEEPMMAQVATERRNGVAANGTVDVRGDTLVVNVSRVRERPGVRTPGPPFYPYLQECGQ